jgi:nucleotide-binding universal stress UspA family protein
MTALEEDSWSTASLRRPVVVGVDDRAASRVALDWAIDEASRHQLPLHILRACQIPPSSRVGPDEDTADGATPAALEEAVARAFALAPLLEVVTETPVADPSVALVEASKKASCLVVGARGRGALAGAILGTTSLDVASHADCPVVVVRELPGPAATPPRVVVGADGSEASAGAIGYAFAQAAERLVPLTVVHVATPDVDGTRSTLKLTGSNLLALSQREQAIAAEEIAGWSEKYPDVRVYRHVLSGHPVKALVDHSQGAELLVVGSRGRSGLPGMLLGSVSQGVLRHAHCPVAVVRAGGASKRVRS